MAVRRPQLFSMTTDWCPRTLLSRPWRSTGRLCTGASTRIRTLLPPDVMFLVVLLVKVYCIILPHSHRVLLRFTVTWCTHNIHTTLRSTQCGFRPHRHLLPHMHALVLSPGTWFPTIPHAHHWARRRSRRPHADLPLLPSPLARNGTGEFPLTALSGTASEDVLPWTTLDLPRTCTSLVLALRQSLSVATAHGQRGTAVRLRLRHVQHTPHTTAANSGTLRTALLVPLVVRLPLVRRWPSSYTSRPVGDTTQRGRWNVKSSSSLAQIRGTQAHQRRCACTCRSNTSQVDVRRRARISLRNQRRSSRRTAGDGGQLGTRTTSLSRPRPQRNR